MNSYHTYTFLWQLQKLQQFRRYSGCWRVKTKSNHSFPGFTHHARLRLSGLCAPLAIIHDVDVSAGAPVHLRNVTPEAFVTSNFEDWRHCKPRRHRSRSNGLRHREQLQALSTVLNCHVIPPAHDITDRDSHWKQVVGTSAVSHARSNGYSNNNNNNNSGAMQMLPPTCQSREAALRRREGHTEDYLLHFLQ